MRKNEISINELICHVKTHQCKVDYFIVALWPGIACFTLKTTICIYIYIHCILLFLPTQHWLVMTSSSGNIFGVTGPLWGEPTGDRWIAPHKGQWSGALKFSLIFAWTNGRANNQDAADLRRHRVHFDVTVMYKYLCLNGAPVWMSVWMINSCDWKLMSCPS